MIHIQLITIAGLPTVSSIPPVYMQVLPLMYGSSEKTTRLFNKVKLLCRKTLCPNIRLNSLLSRNFTRSVPLNNPHCTRASRKGLSVSIINALIGIILLLTCFKSPKRSSCSGDTFFFMPPYSKIFFRHSSFANFSLYSASR